MDKEKIHPGMTVGRWTVLDSREKTARGENKWLCRCQCGTERYVLERSLRCGGSLSCGCGRRKEAENDLTGRKFGALTVVERTGPDQWLCRCDCGGECTVQGSILLSGKKTHCPSRAHQKNYRYTDIAGQRFGRLTALYPARRQDKCGSVIWKCRCDCGSLVEVSYNTLVYSNKKSCGCQKKEHDRKLQTFLTHVAGTSVDMLKSKKLPSDNTTGYKGVYRIRGKYVAKIVFQKKQYLLGSYENIEDAAEARKEAEEVLFDGVAEHYEKWKEYAQADPDWAARNPIQVIVDQSEQKLRVTMLPDLGKVAG